MADVKPAAPAPAGPAKPQPTWIIGLIGLLLGVILTLAAQQGASWYRAYQAKPETFLARNKAADKDVKETASGLQYKVLKPGTGGRPTDADIALITYEGKLTDGKTFDKSEQPTPMGVATVVPGFSEALKLMQRGGQYRLWIKPSLGYGDKEVGPIPANSVLVFDVTMLDFKSEAEVQELQRRRMAAEGGAAPGGGSAPQR